MELKDFVACLSVVEVGDFTKFHILLFALSVSDASVRMKL